MTSTPTSSVTQPSVNASTLDDETVAEFEAEFDQKVLVAELEE